MYELIGNTFNKTVAIHENEMNILSVMLRDISVININHTAANSTLPLLLEILKWQPSAWLVNKNITLTIMHTWTILNQIVWNFNQQLKIKVRIMLIEQEQTFKMWEIYLYSYNYSKPEIDNKYLCYTSTAKSSYYIKNLPRCISP